MKKRGMLFVFEGPDGAGKSTISRGLAEYLTSKNIASEYCSFPGREQGSLGKHIYEVHHAPREYGIDKINPASLQLLHIAAHIDEIGRRIIPILEGGRNVVLDRYWWSTWVYGVVGGVDKKTLRAMINVELEQWKDYIPSTLFLIDRSQSLRKEVSFGTWNRLRKTYYELFDEECTKYPTKIISNEGSPKESLENVLAELNLDRATRISDASKPNVNKHSSDASSQQLPLCLELDSTSEKAINVLSSQTLTPYVYSALSPARPTEVYNTYWYFAFERQNIFFRKFRGDPPPWTEDPILLKHKFTNAYRASDRVSQYLIKHVIYEGEQTPNELLFRILLFKVFNRISTWELLEKSIGEVKYHDYTFERYDAVLTDALRQGLSIFSAAYIMPSGKNSFGHVKKHRNYLMLIETMIEDGVPHRLTDMGSMREVFELLRSYPMMGDFLAYQYAIDINYSGLTNFSESEFVVPGPGARDGIRKCFEDLGGLNEVDIIRMMLERQEEEFSRLNITFKSLWGRRLQLIDCQNLFCEVDKYSRVAHPHIKGKSSRTRIKQIYQPRRTTIQYWYPPKWGINHLIKVKGEPNDTPVPGTNGQ